MKHNAKSATAVTGNARIDTAIQRWIKGTEDRLTVELMIWDAMSDGTIPSAGWTPAMVLEYGLMISPN